MSKDIPSMTNSENKSNVNATILFRFILTWKCGNFFWVILKKTSFKKESKYFVGMLANISCNINNSFIFLTQLQQNVIKKNFDKFFSPCFFCVNNYLRQSLCDFAIHRNSIIANQFDKREMCLQRFDIAK